MGNLEVWKDSYSTLRNPQSKTWSVECGVISLGPGLFCMSIQYAVVGCWYAVKVNISIYFYIITFENQLEDYTQAKTSFLDANTLPFLSCKNFVYDNKYVNMHIHSDRYMNWNHQLEILTKQQQINENTNHFTLSLSSDIVRIHFTP